MPSASRTMSGLSSPVRGTSLVMRRRDANVFEPEKAAHCALDQRVTVFEDQQVIDVLDQGSHHA